MDLVQLFLGQHQPMPLPKAGCTREGHFAHVDCVLLLLLLGLRIGGDRGARSEMCR